MSALAESLRGLSDEEARAMLMALPAERLGPIARELDDEALYVLVHGPAEEDEAPAPKAPQAPRLSAADLDARILSALAGGPLSVADLRERVGVRGLPVNDRLQILRTRGAVARSGPRTGGLWSLPVAPGLPPALAAPAVKKRGAGGRRPGRVDEILAFVSSHPGSATTEISTALGYERSTSAANVLRRLVAAGKVRQENVQEGKARVAHWYPAGQAKSASPRKAAGGRPKAKARAGAHSLQEEEG